MQTDQILLRLYESAAEQPWTGLNDTIFSSLRTGLQFDSGAIVQTCVRPDQSLDARCLDACDTPLERWAERASLNVPDPGLSRALCHQGQAVVTPYRELRIYTGDFKRYMQRYDVAHALTWVMPHQAGTVTEIVSLWRALPRRQPGLREQRLLGALMPHVLRARAINRRLLAGPGDTPASLTLLVNRHGVVQVLGEAAHTLLALEWPTWSGPFLPAALWQGLCASLELRWRGKQLCARAEARDGLLAVHIDRLPQQPALLTPAELRIARLVADGATYKEAARRLGISPATVRNQLHRVYGKLTIAGRRELAPALLR